MGNDFQKLAEKHGEHVPQLDESLVDAHPLITGAVFIPMSTATGDLPLHSIPQIVLNAGMKIKDYQDCIYDINHYSIDGYSRVRKVIRKMEKQMASWGLYHQCLEILINNVEQICYDLNEFELYKYNLLFIPFMHILRDDSNTQHFGIIIDVTNRKRKQMSRQSKRAIARHVSQKNSKNKMFTCFAMGDMKDIEIENKDINNNNGRTTEINIDINSPPAKINIEEKKDKDNELDEQNIGNTNQPPISKLASLKSVASNSVVSEIESELTEAIGMDVMDRANIDANGINIAKQFQFELENISSVSTSICSTTNITRETSILSRTDQVDNDEELSYVDEDIDVPEKSVPYTESHGNKFRLKIYLPKHMRPDDPDEIWSSLNI